MDPEMVDTEERGKRKIGKETRPSNQSPPSDDTFGILQKLNDQSSEWGWHLAPSTPPNTM